MTKTIEDGQTEGLPQASLTSVEIKERAEHTGVFCRAVATKRSEAHLKGGIHPFKRSSSVSRFFYFHRGYAPPK